MNKHGKCMKQKLHKKKKQKQQRERKKKLELARAQVDGDHQVLVYYDKFQILPDIPEGIVCDIMSRLPVKSLMRFKCVCKRWQSLIQKDGFFTDLHYSRLKTAGRVSLVRIGDLKLNGMLNDMKCVISMQLPLPSEIVIGRAADGGAMSLWKYPFPKENCAFCTTNGLLCVMDLVDFCACVYNISTRESTPWIKSTLIKQQEEDKKQVRLTRFGLGYDPVTKEHKVIALWNGTETNELVCEVLTVRHNSWRRIDAVHLSPLCGLHHYGHVESVHVNGFICWLHYHVDYDEEDPYIIQFDVGSEKFKRINIVLPNQMLHDKLCYRLTDIDGRLAILATGGASIQMRILYEKDMETKTPASSAVSSPTWNYYWMEETFSQPHFLCQLLWNYRKRHIPGTCLFMGICTSDDFSFCYHNWKKRSYQRFEINFETSSSFCYYNWEKKCYSSCRVNFGNASSPSFNNIEDVIFTPNLFPVNSRE